jgi:Ca-activated chloride channel family protein
MKRGRLIVGVTVVMLALGLETRAIGMQPPQIRLRAAGASARQAPSFRAGVDLVRIAAVVRDRKGRFVQDLKSRDFEIVDDGRSRPISDLQTDITAVSVAVLFDVSGSMEGRLPNAREAAIHVLSWLDATSDEAAVFTFDTRLVERTPFTAGMKTLPESMGRVVPFGATSLHDAIAQTAKRVGEREGKRRAVVVLTDGADNASRLKPEDVSAIASAIDVPVYIFGIVGAIDNPSEDISTSSVERSAFVGPLSDLAAWTGGHVFVASTPGQRSIAARQIIDELRHQYLIAFESSGRPGWHPLVVRARNKDLTVRARSGYIAGQSSPSAF